MIRRLKGYLSMKGRGELQGSAGKMERCAFSELNPTIDCLGAEISKIALSIYLSR